MKIALIGAGQQGISQAFAFSQLDRVEQVICYDVRPQVIDEMMDRADALGVNDSKIVFATSVENAVRDADVIGINTPMSAFQGVAEQVASHAKKGATLYDNGSGKVQAIKDIMAGLGENPNGVHYFPMHFFVGRAGTGPAFADPKMYVGQTAAIMEAQPRSQPSMLAKINLQRLLSDIGVGNLRTDLSPEDHDESLGMYSHHNTFAVTALMLAFPQVEINGKPVQIGRFLSSTRVAAHGKDGATFWGPIANDNSDAIVAASERFSLQLGRLKGAVRTGGIDVIQRHLGKAFAYVTDEIPADRDFEELSGDATDLEALTDGDQALSDAYRASHMAMPIIFAAASALTAQAYEQQGGQPFSSIGNSSFQDSIRPARASFNEAAALIRDHHVEVLAAIEAFESKYDETIGAIERRDAEAVRGFIEESHRVRTQLPDAPAAARPEFTHD